MSFREYHPVINFIYFTVAIICVVCFNHPAYICMAYLVSAIYYVKLKGGNSIKRIMVYLCLSLLYAAVYGSYNHFGVTVLCKNSIGNNITAESIVYGFFIGLRAVTVLLVSGCMMQVFTRDKVIYIFGRMCPKLSLGIAIGFRTVPRIIKRKNMVREAAMGIGKGSKNIISRFFCVIGWTMEEFIEISNSMKSRGYSLRGRTAYSVYSFSNRDRAFFMGMFFDIVVIWAAQALGYTHILYDPVIIIPPVELTDILLLLIYTLFLAMPLLAQIIAEKIFKHSIDISWRN